METPIRILIVEDDIHDTKLMDYELTKSGLLYQSALVDNGPDFEKALLEFKPDVILSDYKLPAYHGVDAFYSARGFCPDVPFIIVSGAMGEERAVELIIGGVTDYVFKDKLFTLCPKIVRALKQAGERREKLKAEEQLKRSEARLARAQSVAHLGNWEVNLADRSSYWSDEACRIYGLDPGQCIQSLDSFIQFVYPDDREFVTRLVEESIESFTDYAMDHRIVRPDGTIRYIHSEARFELDEQGNCTILHGTAQDMTEQKMAEIKLNETERSLMDIFNNTTDFICTLDKEFRLLTFNDAFIENFHGLLIKQPVIGEDYGRLFPQKFREFQRAHFSAAMKSNFVMSEEEYELHEKQYWFYVKYYPIIRHNEITGVAIFGSNITGRKTAEILMHKSFEELKIASENQSAILNTLPANIVLLDKAGTIIKVNEAWKKFAADNGMPGHFAGLGQNYIAISDQATGQDAATGKLMAQGIKDIIAGKTEKFTLEYPCHSPTQQRWFKAEVRPLEGHDKLGAVVMHIDITDRTLAEEEVNNLNRNLELKIAQRTIELEKANQELEAFSYTVSHDLRSPLQVINGYSSILEKKYLQCLDDDAVTLLNGIKHNTRHMAQLIDDLLNFSHLGRAELKRKELCMNELVKVVLNELKSQAENFGNSITIHPLKSALADGSLMHQVWINLISNAIKYSSRKVDPTIEIGMKQMDGRDVYYVKDNGAGFDMQNYDKLFTVFHRLHKPSEFEGTGVGLALVNSVISRHGGQVWAEAKPNEGAVFYFSLG